MIPLLKEVCMQHDVLLLQETWLTPYNIDFLDNVHEDFLCYSISAVRIDRPLVGRPYGGLSVLWRKSLGIKFSPKTYDDSRILGLSLDTSTRKLLILNVYLPYYCTENYDDYLLCIGNCASIIEEYDHSDILILGDFNAAVGGQFYREWENLCDDTDMFFVDVDRLNSNSYTHINNASLSKSWLDHCLATRSASGSVENVTVLYDYFLSDHLPLCITLNYSNLPAQQEAPEVQPRINWNFNDYDRTAMFFNALSYKLDPSVNRFLCPNVVCHDPLHKTSLSSAWMTFKNTIISEGKRIYGIKTSRNPAIPGWNDYVKELYRQSREAFFDWRYAGSPRHGAAADYMRVCRAQFKLALRQCKAMEDEARALAIANKFKDKNMIAFWRDIKSLNKKKTTLPSRIDQAATIPEICQLWKDKFSGVLNSVRDEQSAEELRDRLDAIEDAPVQLTTPEEIDNIVKTFAAGKATGPDNIPCEMYKNAPLFLLRWLCDFFNGLLIHQCVPTSITESVLCPLLKSSLKDPGCSANYRPIAISTTASKIFENIILNRLENVVQSSDYQFGFKKGHGTDICIFALKEIINYYRSLKTPVFLCFLDIKSAYDRVSYHKLFCILNERGAPKYLICILFEWYSTQKLFVRWGGALSDPFMMSNGIRQGSCLSPHLFNAYVDGLNHRLKDARVGCHVADICCNNLSYADDQVLISPDAKALNKLLEICQEYAMEHYVTYSTVKTEAMLILPIGAKVENVPDIYLNDVKVKFVEQFRYLGHIITNVFRDDDDIERETRNLYIRGNTIVRRFGFLSMDVKRTLFKSYCYPMYTCSLWSKYRESSLNKLKVAYNSIMRKLVGTPPWSSARTIFVRHNVRSFYETVRIVSYNLMSRVLTSCNNVVQSLLRSDSYTMSRTRSKWLQNLFINPPVLIFRL